MVTDDGMHDLPIDGFVVVNRDISKSNGFSQSISHMSGQNSLLGEDIKGLPHGFWGWHVHGGNNVCADVHRQLHCSAEVERDDVLQVKVILKLGSFYRELVLNAR